MKILYWHPDLGIGGTQKNLELFAIGMMQRGHECMVCYYEGGDEHRLNNIKAIRDDALDFKLMPIGTWTIDRDNRKAEFASIIDKYKPDIIHVFRSGFVEFPEPGGDFDLGKSRFVETNVFGHIDNNPYIDKTLFMSEYLMRFIARVPREGRYDFIPIPADIPISFDNKINLDMFPPKTIVLGRCGRAENGIYDPIAVDAVGLLVKRRPELEKRLLFLLLSPPPNMIKDLQRYGISYLVQPTTVNNILIDAFYNSMDIYLHSRRDGETCGATIQESFIHKKPVITHVARPNDGVTFPFQAQCSLVEQGGTGFVIRHDVEEYANALEKLIDNVFLRQKMGQAGYEKAIAEFETGLCVGKLEKVYKELLND